MCIAIPPPLHDRCRAAPPWWRWLSTSAWRLSVAGAGIQALAVATAWVLGSAPPFPAAALALTATLFTGGAIQALPARWHHAPLPYPSRVLSLGLVTLGALIGILSFGGAWVAAGLLTAGGHAMALRALWWMRKWSGERPWTAEAVFALAVMGAVLASFAWPAFGC